MPSKAHLDWYDKNPLRVFRTTHLDSDKLTQSQIASHLNVSVESVKHWERGETVPNYTNMVKISELISYQRHVTVRGLLCEWEGWLNKRPTLYEILKG